MKENENKVKDYLNKLIEEYEPTPLTEDDEEFEKYCKLYKERFGKNAYIAEPSESKKQTIESIKICLEKNEDLLISRFLDKEPYIKDITEDRIINITGESGSGKSYFSDKYIKDDNYIVIDTDVVFSDRPSDNNESIELRTMFSDKPKDYLITNFDDFYLKTIDYFKDSNKTIVIDSAQYRNIKDYSILKGKLIVMRTSINTCYERVLNRYKNIMKDNYNEEDYNKYAERKKGVFSWYKGLNKFLENIDRL